MPSVRIRLTDVQHRIETSLKLYRHDSTPVNLIAVSKQQSASTVEDAIEAGVTIFGENRVQEAQEKFSELKQKYPHIQLHLIGHLQTNKVDEAVMLFDVIHSLDSIKLADALYATMQKQNKFVPCFLQVNIGEEPQKSGVHPRELETVLTHCQTLGLPVIGLMCIPPADEPPALYFALLKKLARQYKLPRLSMGMSSDYETAIQFGATDIRIGSSIFGSRAS